MHRRKKICYIPGMISLAGTLLLQPYVYKRTVSPPVYYMSISVPSTNTSDHYSYSAQRILKQIQKMKVTGIMLDSNRNTNLKKIALARYEARKLMYTFDTTTVIRISFSEDVLYREFMMIRDFCYDDDIGRFVFWDKHFFIFGQHPPIPRTTQSDIPMIRCGYMSFPPKPHRTSMWERVREFFYGFRLWEIFSLITVWGVLLFLRR